jgi:hypothetical protein
MLPNKIIGIEKTFVKLITSMLENILCQLIIMANNMSLLILWKPLLYRHSPCYQTMVYVVYFIWEDTRMFT